MIGKPHPLLRGLVARGYADRSRPPERADRFVLPASTSVAVVVKLADSALRPPEFVQGVQASYTVIDGGCAPSYLEFSLTPLGAYTLFGMPMDHLAGRLVDLGEVTSGDGPTLGEAVRDAPTRAQRFAAVDEFLLRRLDGATAVSPEVRLAWKRLVASGGRVPIRELRDEVGWSHKHLIAKFTRQVGLTPKRAARVIRFERVLRAVDRDPHPNWATLAVRFGYADQAHLIRDFGAFTGLSPAAYTR